MISAVVLAIACLAMVGLDVAGFILARRGSVRSNSVFGLRTSTTRRSPSAWSASQRAGWSVRLVLVPVYLVSAALLLGSVALETEQSVVLPTIIVCGVLELLVTILSLGRATTAARRAAPTT